MNWSFKRLREVQLRDANLSNFSATTQASARCLALHLNRTRMAGATATVTRLPPHDNHSRKHVTKVRAAASAEQSRPL